MADSDNQESESGLREFYERHESRWKLLTLYIVAAVVVGALLVFGGRAIYRHSHQPTAKPAPTITKQSSSLVKNDHSSGKNSNPKANTGQPGGNLPDSGPGQVIGLFVGTSLVAAGLHFIVQLRRTY